MSSHTQGDKAGFDRTPSADEIAASRLHLSHLFLEFDDLIVSHSAILHKRSRTSALYLDDEAIKPYLLSTETQFAVSSCIDHLLTVRNLTAQDLIPNLAAYTLIRSAVEHASLAMWFLDPDDPNERRRRVLIQAAKGAKLLEDALKDIGISGSLSFDDKFRKINAKTVSLQLNPITMAEVKNSGIKARVRWSGLILQGLGVGAKEFNLVSTVWQIASGIAHANTSAGLTLLNRRALMESEETQSTIFNVSTSEVEIARVIQICIYLLGAVIHLARYRAGLEVTKYPTFSKGQQLAK